MSAKLQEDPLVAIKKREEETRRQFLQNPVQLKKLQEALKAREEHLRAKKKKSKRSSKDLDRKIAEKLQLLKTGRLSSLSLKKEKKKKKAEEENALNTILMHKFNELKSKLTDEDLKDILSGKVSDSESSSESSSEEKKKKSKKKKKQRKKSESTSDSDNGEDSEVDRKRKKCNRSRTPDNRKIRSRNEEKRKNRSGSYDRIVTKNHYSNRQNTENYTKSDNCGGKFRRSESSRKEKRRSRSRSQSKERNYSKKKNLDTKTKTRRSRSRSQEFKKSSGSKKESRRKRQSSSSESDSNDKKRRNHSESSDEGNEKKKRINYGLVNADGSKIKLSEKSRYDKEVEKSKKVPEKNVTKLPEKSAKPVKLSEEEKERRRQEMMKNAQWRDKEREQTVRRYRENDARESKQEFDPNFLHKELLKSANSSTVEGRIKSNINNIQRSKSDMNSHFSRRH